MNFLANGSFIGSASLVNNQAQLTTEFGNLGALSIQAMYAGDSNYAMSSSATLTETVVPAPDFTMSAATPAPINPGQQATSVVTITGCGWIHRRGNADLRGESNLSYGHSRLQYEAKAQYFECDSYQRDRDAHHDNYRSFAVDAVQSARAAASCTGKNSNDCCDIRDAGDAFDFGCFPPHHRKSVECIRCPRELAIPRCRRAGSGGVANDARMRGGGGGGGTHLTNLGTQPFTYTVTVTGTGNGTTKITFVTVVVQ